VAYDDSNIFAKILRDEAPAYRVYEDADVLAFLDVMPQVDGHTLVIPKTPAESVFDLPPDVLATTQQRVQMIARGVRQAFEPDGIAITQFNGRAAGQTIYHYHVHILPRYADQPARRHARELADPESLEESADRIRKALA
jgi:histidine triad (HIT) family protein